MANAPSLITAFAPPEGWTGVAAILCALSADAEIVKDMLAEFTGETDGQRAHRGEAVALLALDQRSPREPLRIIPGLHLAEPRLGAWPRDLMLHAKVALLGFARDASAPIQRLRMVVSTGNWTTASLKDQVEMLRCDELDLEANQEEQLRSDFRAAADFLEQLISRSEKTALFQKLPTLSRIEALRESAGAIRGGRLRPRFFHSLEKPMLSQILERFEPARGAWNWLYAGSGFFEQPSSAGAGVLQDIGRRLTNHMTRQPDRWVVVNRDCAGALAKNSPQGWTRCLLLDEKRRLHAKFLAAARQRDGSHSDLTVYLGSGNLTVPGMLSSATRVRGGRRIEAGVVFKHGSSVEDEALWKGLLPNSDEANEALEPGVGDGECEIEALPIASPPILYAERRYGVANPGRIALRLVKAEPEEGAQILLGSGAVLDVPPGRAECELPEPIGAYLEVRRSTDAAWERVPVIGEDGSYARVVPAPGDVEDAINAILAFPAQPDDREEDGLASADALDPSTRPQKQAGAGDQPGRYPARDAMRIIEAVARHVEVRGGTADQLRALCRTIRYTLTEGVLVAEKQRLAALGVNIFSAWRTMPFEHPPEHAEWNAMIDAVATDWGMDRLPSFPKIMDGQDD